MKCRACGRGITRGANTLDMLCGDNRGSRMSCTMRCFLAAEGRGLVSRPVSRDFWTSPQWLVAVDQWLETQLPPKQDALSVRVDPDTQSV